MEFRQIAAGSRSIGEPLVKRHDTMTAVRAQRQVQGVRGG
jgi:hypothetical protein